MNDLNVLIHVYLFGSHFSAIQLDIGEVCAGLLGGLVAICAPCASIHPWEGLVIGLIAGPVTIGCKSAPTVHRLLDMYFLGRK